MTSLRKKRTNKASGCPSFSQLAEKGIFNLTDKELKCIGEGVTKGAGKISSRRNAKIAAEYMEPRQIQKLGKVPYFLTASSAKVQHSLASAKWLNVVLYLAPADEGLLSFWREYGHDAPHLVPDIVAAVRTAARHNEAWRGQAPFRRRDFDRFHGEYDRIIGEKNLDPNYLLPDSANLMRPLSMCPYASPNCRAVCLNTSGQGGLRRTDIVRRVSPELWEMYNRMAATRLEGNGYTFEDDLRYLYLKGHQAMYGGAANDTIASRLKRTHMLLLAWAKQGVMENSVNDILFYEALQYKDYCRRLGIPMALRLNGTSDLPVETLKLHNAEIGGVKLAGRGLVETLGNLGIVCYDYTKDYHKMKTWMNLCTWKNGDAVARGKNAVVSYAGRTFSISNRALLKTRPQKTRFPSSYYLCLSWSEVNGRLALQTLFEGGNVVMVFRRSYETPRGEKLVLPTVAGAKGALPNMIRLAQLSKNPEDADWEATIVDGDRTDLRFDDGHHVGEKRGGLVIGLVAKGEAMYSKNRYNNARRTHLYRLFTMPATLEKQDDTIRVVVRRNPAFTSDETKAVETVDGDLLDQATSFVDGCAVTTTAMAT